MGWSFPGGSGSLDPLLTSIAGLTFGANNFIYGTGSDTAAVGTITAFGRSLVDDPDAAAGRATLALGTVATLASDTDTTLAANSDVKVATQKATKAYVDAAVTGLLDFKGSTDASANPNYPAASKGDAYLISVAGKVGGASGKSVDIGDVYVASADNAGGTEASVGTSWFVLEHNLAGTQPLDATLTALAAFNTNGLLTQTAADTFVGRAITGTAAEITVANGDGVSGAPTLSLPTALTFTGKTITGGSITPAAAPTTTAIGYLGSPINTQDAAYTTVMSDAGKTLYHTSGSTHTWTIDSNANVAYPIGTMISFSNESGGGNVTIAITSDTLRWGSSTGSRTLAANGTATAQKMTATSWRLTGDGIT